MSGKKKNDIFAFDEGEKKPSGVKKIECFNTKSDYFNGNMFKKLSFLASGVSPDGDKDHYWMPYIYPIEFEGIKCLASTNGHVLHYTPSEEKTVYKVEKQTKNEVTLAEAISDPGYDPDYQKHTSGMVKVIPAKDKSFEFEYGIDYDYRHHKELFLARVMKLTGDRFYFKFEDVGTFIDNFCDYYGKVKIYAPRENPERPWRMEFWCDDRRRDYSLCYGLVTYPIGLSECVTSIKDLYAKKDNAEIVSEPDHEEIPQSEEDEAAVDSDKIDAEAGEIEDDGSDTAPLLDDIPF